jgi:hypothetical protein
VTEKTKKTVSMSAAGGLPIRRGAAIMKLRQDFAVAFLIVILFFALVQGAHAEAASDWDFADHPYRTGLFAGLAAAIIAGAGVLLFFSARKPKDSIISSLRPSFFFWLGMAYATLLLLAAIVYNASYNGKGPYLFGGMLPIAVPWFGAVGAVTISLQGVFEWSESRWNPEYNYWHLGRPVFGAILGIIGFFLYVLIISSSGTPPVFLQVPKSSPEQIAAKDFIVYYVVAFLAGYREETFRELIKRVTDMILKPAPQDTGAPLISFRRDGVTQSEIRFTETTAGPAKPMTIEILNSGKASLLEPRLSVSTTDLAAKGVFGLTNDQVSDIKELRPNEMKTVDITFHPPTAGTYSGVLSVSGRNLTAPAQIQVTATANAGPAVTQAAG